MMDFHECVVCGATIYYTELHLCAEHQIWHYGWLHVPRMARFAAEVFEHNRAKANPKTTDFDQFRGFAHWEYMHGQPDALHDAPAYPLWVTVHDIDRRAKYVLEQPDEGAA